ncbi:MAG TPA: CvpA family protein [Firmicutes bacterium]|nr:CvpA family protein [Bacillota bacterium]
MVGKWIDLVTLVFLALGLLKGFKKGLIRELFSLMGGILAIIIAYHSYQGLSAVLLDKYPLSPWQGQAIAFVALLLGISLLGAFLGYIWSKAISLTPFAVLDHIGGAAFGVFKVGAVLLLLLIFLNAAEIGSLEAILQESVVVQQVSVLVPFVHEYLAEYWPGGWYRPDWLFPADEPLFEPEFSKNVLDHLGFVGT